jgi:hypothetical protein
MTGFTKIKSTRGLHVITYSAILDVPRELAWYLAGLLNDERYWRRTRRGRRALTCYRQSVLVLRWFLDATRVHRLARHNHISLSTAYRYLHEGIDVLADAAPDLHEVLAQQRQAQVPYPILDGTLIPTDRVRTPSEKGNDLWYCGQHHTHGGNIQLLASRNGYPLWTSPVTPGSFHDITAAREHCLGALVACRIPILADKAYRAAGIGIHTPVRKPGAANPSSTPTTAPETNSPAASAAKGNAPWHYSKPAGKPCAESPSAPGASATSSPPRWSSPTTNTTQTDLTDNTSL